MTKKINGKYRFKVVKTPFFKNSKTIKLQNKVFLFYYKTVSELVIFIEKLWNPFGIWNNGEKMLRMYFDDGTPSEHWDIDSGFDLNKRMDKMYSDFVKENNIQRQSEIILS
jgi:hypothetical protein